MQKPNYITIILALAFGFYVWHNHKSDKDVTPNDNPVVVKVTVEQAVKQAYGPAFRKDMGKIFTDTAALIESGKFKYSRDILDHVKQLSEDARNKHKSTFDTTVGELIPDEITGNEKSVSELFKRIGKSW